MRSSTLVPGLLVGAALSTSLLGCSWSRFDDVETDTPVVLLKKPSKLKAGFGVSLSTASSSDDPPTTRVLVGGSRGFHPAATFSLGRKTRPQLAAVDTGSCNQDAPCYLAEQTAGLGIADVGARDPERLCFVLGYGKSEGADAYGLIGRCSSTVEYTLPVPESVTEQVIEGEILLQDDSANTSLRLATDKAEAPGLAAGAPGADAALAWFYLPESNQPIELVPPGERDESFGSAVAVLRIEEEGGEPRRIVAVGAPGAAQVWLFSQTGAPIGCLGGPEGFGKTLASGPVDTDESDDLVIIDSTNATVISGEALRGLAPAASITCSLSALPEGGILGSFGCGSRDTLAGCSAADFGASVTVGDLDGDGDGEVIVGAPAMKVRETRRAGAVLVYDVEGDRPGLLTDQLFFSSPEGGDELGRSVIAAEIDGRDVVVAGAPGNGRAAIFYCSSLLAGGGGRCE